MKLFESLRHCFTEITAVLISFSGIDGSGKSTQMSRLIDEWTNEGEKVVRVWSRGGYTAGCEWLKRLLRLLSRNRVPVSGDVAGRDAYFKSSIVRRLWLWVALWDLIRLYVLCIRMMLWRGNRVVCDRYVGDTLIDFKIMFPNENVERWMLWKIVERMAPKPDIAFLLIVPADVSIMRAAAKQDGHAEAEIPVRRRHEMYQWLSRSGKFQIVNGEVPIEQAAAEIQRAVKASRAKACGICDAAV